MLKRLLKTEQTILIETAVKELIKRSNNDVKANISGCASPQKVIKQSTRDGFFPDITAVKEGNFRIFAVETSKTINNASLKEKWSLFSQFATQNDALFFIVFPRKLATVIKKKVAEVEIQAQFWEL